MKSLLPPLALAFVLAACNAPAPEPAGNGAPATGAPEPADTPPPPVTTPPPADDAVDDDTGDDVDDGGDVAHDDGDASEIPERYRGEWNADPAACGTGSDESRLVIGEDSLRFHESSGPVRSVRMDGNELVVVARLTGEGETRDATYRFRISADGDTLTDAGSGLARQRCR